MYILPIRMLKNDRSNESEKVENSYPLREGEIETVDIRTTLKSNTNTNVVEFIRNKREKQKNRQ